MLARAILTPAASEIVVLIALGLSLFGVIGLVLAVLLGVRLARLRRGYAVLIGRGVDSDRSSLVELVNRRHAEVTALSAAVDDLQRYDRVLTELVQAAVSGVHLVRYDAFQEMGGRMSFSAALVDAHGNGVILTTINGRSDNRTYLRLVTGGVAEVELSEEEQQALSGALASASRVP